MEVVRQAGYALNKASSIYCPSELQIEKKGHGDWVTYADRMVEADLFRWLRDQYPEHGIFSEETLYPEEDREFVWYIDPIDGTTNYIRSNSAYSISIGLRHQGKTVLGVVCGRDEVYAAAAGKCLLIEKYAAGAHALENALIGFSPRTAQWVKEKGGNPLGLMSAAGGYRYIGSSALELCRVACGRLDFYFSSSLKPWDYAGALAVLQAAGAKAAVWHAQETLVFAWREDKVLEQALVYLPKGIDEMIRTAMEACSC
jgi:myo-inositol-1(or 4)-monophosphatase